MLGDALMGDMVLGDLLNRIINDDIEVIDLAQPLNEHTLVIQLPEPFKNTSGFKLNKISHFDEDGPAWSWNTFTTGEHVGTHFDAPNHWISGKDNDSVDTIPSKNMIGEAFVIDVTAKCTENPDYILTVEDIYEFENKFGKIKEQSWVILRSGWGKFAQDPVKFFNVDENGMSHTPGFGKEAAQFLAYERNVLGVGTETVGTDAGNAGLSDPPFPNHYYMHEANKYGLCSLANVDKLPPRGAVIIATPLKITDGTGSPVRPIALVSNKK